MTGGPRRGFTLVELLVALAVAAVLAAILVALVRSGARGSAIVADRARAGQTGILAASLLRFEIERAGRAVDADGLRLRLDPAGAGGDRIEVRYRAEAHRSDPADVRGTFFAAADAAGRANLYRLPASGSRQPWLLGVDGVHVVAGVDAGGATVARGSLADGARLGALVVEVRFDDGSAERFTAATRRAGAVRIGSVP